jgi:hypothetical protein
MKFLSPNRVAEADMTWVMTLADIPPQGPFPELLPYENDSDKALKDIRNAIEAAAPNGEILLLTSDNCSRSKTSRAFRSCQSMIKKYSSTKR